LAVVSSDASRPKKEFPFQIPAGRYIVPRIRGDESPAITINHLAALAWVNTMTHLIYPRILLTYKAPPKQENAGRFGGNQGGQRFRQNNYQGGQGGQNRGGGNYQQRQAPAGGAKKEFDDADFD
jgi:hypothetical protein